MKWILDREEGNKPGGLSRSNCIGSERDQITQLTLDSERAEWEGNTFLQEEEQEQSDTRTSNVNRNSRVFFKFYSDRVLPFAQHPPFRRLQDTNEREVEIVRSEEITRTVASADKLRVVHWWSLEVK